MQLSQIPLTSILPYQGAGDTQCGAYCLAYYDWLTGTGTPSPFVKTSEKPDLDFHKSSQLKTGIQTIFDRIRFGEGAIPKLPPEYAELAAMLAHFSSPVGILRELRAKGLDAKFYTGDLASDLVGAILAAHRYPDRPLNTQQDVEDRLLREPLPLDHSGSMISLWGMEEDGPAGAKIFLPYHYVLFKREGGVLYVIDPGDGKIQPVFPDPHPAIAAAAAAAGTGAPTDAVPFDQVVKGMKYGHAGFVF